MMQSFDFQGIFMRPNETEEEYMARAKMISVDATCPVLESLQKIYGFFPGWVPLSYDDSGIHFWEAGISWMDEQTDPPMIAIQLRQTFETHERLYGLYSKEEVLCHEYVHAVRFLFAPSKYDEHFCYFTSYTNGLLGKIRAFLGPLFQQSTEVIGLFVLLALAALLSATGIFFYVVCLLFAFTAALLGRLTLRWWRWCRCRSHLAPLGIKALHLMVRLVDSELELFSSLSYSGICRWIEERKDFRWQYLYKTYFPL